MDRLCRRSGQLPDDRSRRSAGDIVGHSLGVTLAREWMRLRSAHLGVLDSPQTWQASFDFLSRRSKGKDED